MQQNIPFNSGAVDPVATISAGWELIKPNYWLLLGITLVGMIIGGCVPCVSMFLVGPMMVGIYYVMFRQMRGEPIEFGMLFKGFEKFVPAMVIGLVLSIPGIIITGARFSINIGSAVLQNEGRRGGTPDWLPAVGAGMALVGIIIALLAIVISIIWNISFMFALPILADRDDIGIVDCLKLSARAGWANFGGLFLLMILMGLLMILGVIALCIGWIFLLPLVYAANAIAFRAVFPEKFQANNYNEPPAPGYYGGSFGNQ
jgi:uncharacterized membrane protein